MNFVSDYRAVYDVVFMDIEMPHLNGMNAAKKMRRADPDVALIFVTHLAKYALQGYEVDAVGYILKPVDYFSLHRKLKQITGRCEKEGGEEIFVKTVSGLVRISLRTLRYVEVLDHWLVYHTAHGDHKVYGSIARAERRSGGIVVRIENYFGGTLEFSDGLPRTTKGEDGWHGFGLKSVKYIAQKYGGDLSCRVKDGFFILQAVFPV